MDFGFSAGENSENGTQQEVINEEATNLETGKAESIEHSEATPLEDGSSEKNEGDNNTPPVEKKDDTTEHDITPGTVIELDDAKYTVDENGNVVDENGNIFKEAKDVAEWIKSFDKVDETKDKDEMSISTIQDALGIDILDDNDKPIEFENSPEGIKAYVNAVIETSREEIEEATINSLIAKYPFVQDVINYYITNNNSLDGYKQDVDRSDIEIDENNVEQQKAIIRAAWKEQGRKGNVEDYLKYLESTKTLTSVAEEELEGLKEADRARKDELARKAREKEDQDREAAVNYWNGVKGVIDSRKIAGYKIPDSIIIERDGKKLSVTPDDFFNYMYRVDSKGYSQYQYDLAKETPESRRDDAILRAYLKFVGGNYSNLIDMAINEKEVAKLRLKAKENRNSQIRITKPSTDNSNKGGKINFGY